VAARHSARQHAAVARGPSFFCLSHRRKWGLQERWGTVENPVLDALENFAWLAVPKRTLLPFLDTSAVLTFPRRIDGTATSASSYLDSAVLHFR